MTELSRRAFLGVGAIVAAGLVGHHRPNHAGGPKPAPTPTPTPTPTATPVTSVYPAFYPATY